MAEQYQLQPLTHDLHKIVYMLDKRAAALLAGTKGITFSQFRIMFIISHKEHVSQVLLAKAFDISPAAISSNSYFAG